MTSDENVNVVVASVAEDFGLGGRERSDACPGALTFHHAADGAIGRLRFPGGRISSAQWSTLATLARNFGDGNIHATTRGNLQIRGISDEQGFTAAVIKAGLLPSAPHDKIRNIIASPLSSLAGDLANELDRALLNSEIATGLSGRTLFGIDAGDGEILRQQPDFGVLLTETSEHAQLILGGSLCNYALPLDDVARTLTELAERWQEQRGKAWRVSESLDAHPGLLEHPDLIHRNAETLADTTESPQLVGWLERPDGNVILGAGFPFGVLPNQVAQVLAAVDRPVVVTPWHSFLIFDLDEAEAEQVAKVLAPMGMIFDAHSPRLRVTACTGLPGCEKSASDVRADAAAFLSSSDKRETEGAGTKIHFSGCERRCGHPRDIYVDYLAIGEGEYDVTTKGQLE